jgi:hypothetical protein
VKNSDIIRDLPKLPFLRHERKRLLAQIKDLERQVRGLEKQARQLDDEIKTLEDVSEIFEGVALYINDKDYSDGLALDVHAVDTTARRYAEVYPNAHSKGKDWGLKLRQYGQASGGGSEDWRGCDWGYAEAVLVAKRWAAHGTKPTDDFEIMCKLRHKLDPARRASKRRVLAFEAAFTAGHRELAAELLVGAPKLTRMKWAALATALNPSETRQ